jgi:hypothetical protein
MSLWWRGSHQVQESFAPDTTNGVPEVLAAVTRMTQERSNAAPAQSQSGIVVPGTFGPPRAEAPPVVTPQPTLIPDAVARAESPTLSTGGAVQNPESVANDTPRQPTSPPSEPAYKLQAIFYRNAKASAVINGQTVFVGEDIDGAKLLSIERQFVRVVANGKTNVLKLR